MLIIRLNTGLVFVVITVHVSIHEAHPQCSRTGLTLGVINILVIPEFDIKLDKNEDAVQDLR